MSLKITACHPWIFQSVTVSTAIDEIFILLNVGRFNIFGKNLAVEDGVNSYATSAEYIPL
jgi:hypothetical protein